MRFGTIDKFVNSKGGKLHMKKQTIVGFVLILVTFMSAVFLINYLHYYYIDVNYVGNGIFLNLIAFVSNLLIGIFGFRLVSRFEECEIGWLLLISSPILLFLLVMLLEIGGASVEGYVAWISIGPSDAHYLQLLLYLLFICVPVGIDGVIKKKFKNEEIIFSGISFLNTIILVFTKDIQAVIWYSIFSLFYYFLKRGIHIMPIGALVIPVIFGFMYDVFNMSPFLIYEKITEGLGYKYAYKYPLVSMQQDFSVFPIILVIILELLICYLLKEYIKKYVVDAYKQQANFLCGVMAIMCIYNTILDLLPFETLLYGSVPFSTSESFVCLVPILMILMLGQKAEQSGIN